MNVARKDTIAPDTPAFAGAGAVLPADAAGADIAAPLNTSPDRFAGLPWGATWVLMLSFAALIASLTVIVTHTTHGLFLYTLAVLICLMAGITDAATQRVPYMLTYPAILLGLLLNCMPVIFKLIHLEAGVRWMGAVGPAQALAGLVVCGILGLLGVLFAGVGGGDAKLITALGALLGLSQVGAVFLVALVLSIAYAVINLAAMRKLDHVARIIGYRTLELLYLRQFEITAPDTTSRGLKTMIPMGVPLALAMLITPFININAWLGGA